MLVRRLRRTRYFVLRHTVSLRMSLVAFLSMSSCEGAGRMCSGGSKSSSTESYSSLSSLLQAW